jgi:hypothetical protein
MVEEEGKLVEGRSSEVVDDGCGIRGGGSCREYLRD